jgi:hypothetical protein
MAKPGETPWNRLVFAVFLLPIGAGLIQRLAKPNHWFRDFDAFSCAAQRLNHHLPLYTNMVPCLGQKPTSYVYPPYLAQAWALLQHSAGHSGATALYGGLYFFLLIYLLHLFVVGRAGHGAAWVRAPLLVVVGADIFTCGNIAVIIHGVIALTAVFLWDYPVLTLALIVLASAIKPVFLVYAVLFLFHPMIWRKKIGYGLAAILLGLTPFLYFRFHDASRFAKDMKLIGYFTLVNDRGVGFLHLAGISSFGPAVANLYVASLYVLFAGLLIICGWAACVFADAAVQDRMWIAIAIAVFADPRLMFYDFLTVAPGLACLIDLTRQLGERFHRRTRAYAVTACLICLMLNSRGGQSGLYLFVPAFSLLFVIIGGTFISRNRDRLRLYFTARLPVRA